MSRKRVHGKYIREVRNFQPRAIKNLKSKKARNWMLPPKIIMWIISILMRIFSNNWKERNFGRISYTCLHSRLSRRRYFVHDIGCYSVSKIEETKSVNVYERETTRSDWSFVSWELSWRWNRNLRSQRVWLGHLLACYSFSMD
jgi:hypothetical protein